jgi:flagellar hook-associated protein 3 FlgL
MLAGLSAFNSTFLLDLNTTQSRISQTNQQLSSGYRVNQASDAPGDIAIILGYQDQASQIKQVQTNLNLANTEASVADGALSSATSLMNQLTTIAAQGASSTVSATTRSSLGTQVQAIAQQLVGLANTAIQGKYIFGGDDSSTPPYTFNWSVTGGATQNNTASNTATIQDISGQTTNPRMTAQQIFDAQNPDGTPATGNILQAVYSLGQALQNNDQAGVLAATDTLKAANTQLGQATTFYGNAENWIQNASSNASSALTTVKTEVGNLRDTDIAAAATDLTTEQTAMQAALAAHGSLNVKSLFDYMG